MASNEIVFKVKVEKDGNLSVVAKEAEKAAKGTDKLGKSTDNLEKKRSKYHKAEKGVGQAGLSSSKSFSKMRQTIGGEGGSSGLVGAYAVLAANIFALTAAFGALQRAAQVKQLEEGLTSLGTASGVALKSVSEGLRAATGNALSLEDAMRSVALASSAGFDSSSIERLGDVARKASIALGRDTADSLNRLTKGAIKLEPELLDELGIMVRLDDATQTYATAVNKTAGDLTTFEKRQAFMNAVLEEGERKFAAMGNVPTNAYDQLSATFADLTKNLLGFLNNGLIPIVNFFAGSQAALFGAMVLFGRGIATQMIPALGNLGKKYTEAAQAAHAHSLQQLKSLKNIEGGGANLKKLAKAYDPAIDGQAGLNKMMKTAENSYKSNTAGLARLKANVESTAEELADKKAKVDASSDALKVLTQYQKDFNTTTAQEAKASASAAAASGNFRGAMEGLGIAFGKMDEEGKESSKGLGKWEKRGKSVGLTASKAALSVKVLGIAFLNAIPMIGQIIFALGIFISVAKKVIEFFKSDEQKEYESIVKKQAEANLELVESLKEVSAYEKGQGKIITDVTQSYTAQFNALTQLNKQLKALNKTGKTGGATMFSDRDQAAGGYKDMFKTMIEGGQITTDMLPQLTKGLVGFEKTAVENAVTNKVWGGLMDKTSKTILNKTLPAMVQWPKVMHNLTMSTKEANQSLDEFVNAISFKTTVDAVLASFSSLQNSMKDLGTGTAKDWVAGFKENAGSNMLGLIDMKAITAQARAKVPDSMFGKPGWQIAKEEQKLIKARVAELQAEYKEEQKLQRLSKARTSSAKALNKILKDQRITVGAAAEIEENKKKMALEEVAVLESNQRLFEQTTLLKKGDADYTARVAAFENEIAEAKRRSLELGQTALATAKENLRIAEHGQQVAGEVNKDIQRRIDLLKRETSARDTLSKNAAKEANRKDPRNRGKGALSAAQDFKRIYQDMDENGETLEMKKLSAITQEANMKHAMISMEMTMLKFRLQVLMAEIKQTDEKNKTSTNVAPLQDIIDNIEGEGGLKSTALALVTQEREAAESVIREAKAVGIEAVQDQLRTGELGTGVGSSGEAAAVLKTGTGTASTEESEGTGHTGNPEEIAQTFLDKVDVFKTGMTGLIETAQKLGPDGELIAAVAQGGLAIADAWGVAGAAIKDGGDKMAVGGAIATAAAATVSQIANMMAASSQAKIAGIDNEIKAEQKRDGKSKESVAKIKALEKKKETEKRKAFENNKKMMMAEIIISTAAAIMKAAPNVPLMVAMGVMGALNLAVAAGASYQGGGSLSGAGTGPGSISVGERSKSSDLSKSQSARGELAYFRGEQGMGGAENFRSAFYGKKHRAAGGNTGYVVGEQGPELFMPDRPGTIVPADDTAGVGGSTNVTFSISAIDAAGVEDVLVQQQGNIIGMLREAANSYGEDFMEDLDESTYTTPVARRA